MLTFGPKKVSSSNNMLIVFVASHSFQYILMTLRDTPQLSKVEVFHRISLQYIARTEVELCPFEILVLTLIIEHC